jgi:hypothetical protein
VIDQRKQLNLMESKACMNVLIVIVIVQSKQLSSTNAVAPSLARDSTTNRLILHSAELCFAMLVLTVCRQENYLLDKQSTGKSPPAGIVTRWILLLLQTALH